MIRLEGLNKTFIMRGRRKVIARNMSMTFPKGVSVALLGRNGAGKSSLLAMISGFLAPDSGKIHIDGTLSWPVGFAGSFHNDLTGAQNIRFIARVYGVDTDGLIDFVRDFAELGPHFDLPVRTYSSGMKSRLSFGVSMGVRFDTYLVDEVTAVGDADFKKKSRAVFSERMNASGSIFVTHSMAGVRNFCEAVAILENGKLTYYDDIEEGIAAHQENMGGDEDDD
ncbi:ABC transporter ATP-binding protein [Roseobacter sp. N2S]|uniref:ABC transporter ATP-binding protein n=1 Tax=Roseobacter sp. N2S TaxID=2663844 RepID=UPI002856F909|nr:ABC transporter ATP-binding protein [Roseobacter sp. N2S]MDR6267642.1 capsular polysaccharide transport system ATP-binding protein [Roseobacter sp. N2S]